MPLPFKPVRTFSANVGDDSIGNAGPDAIENDIDKINKMFDPMAVHEDGTLGGISIGNLAEGEATSIPTPGKLAKFDVNGNINVLASSISNAISVITGTVPNGGTVPLPTGYTAQQCRTFVSPYDTNSGSSTWDVDEGMTTNHLKIVCKLNADRTVTIGQTVYTQTSHTYQFIAGIANYIVIGIK